MRVFTSLFALIFVISFSHSQAYAQDDPETLLIATADERTDELDPGGVDLIQPQEAFVEGFAQAYPEYRIEEVRIDGDGEFWYLIGYGHNIADRTHMLVAYKLLTKPAENRLYIYLEQHPEAHICESESDGCVGCMFIKDDLGHIVTCGCKRLSTGADEDAECEHRLDAENKNVRFVYDRLMKAEEVSEYK
ncbi:MAG: hypothetical protein CL946_12115 [Ectothiorhodospiraceae bacterium]|nr:hypothetical protein [Ectothiorhodospiraceae bacterium]